MTAVSQLVPNFFGGVNEQPDELKKPGQVRDCVNFLPDVTYGLIKRPGMQWISGMDVDGNGTWFNFIRENDNNQPSNYVGQVSQEEGTVSIFNVEDGSVPLIWYTSTPINPDRKEPYQLSEFKVNEESTLQPEPLDYLRHNNFKLKYVGYKESILITNPSVPVEMGSVIEPTFKGYYAFI